MLQGFLAPELRRRGIDLKALWFQQDRAIAHTPRALMAVVREMIPGHVIFRGGNVAWPARSPDLSVRDYFLLGYLKSRVLLSKPNDINELKASIQEEITAIRNNMVQTAMRNLRDRLQQCIQNDGRHLREALFKK